MDENKPPRRWLSFGIRDLLWAMVVVGMFLAWRFERRTLIQRRAVAEGEAQKARTEAKIAKGSEAVYRRLSQQLQKEVADLRAGNAAVP
jgi:hypothetical protein